jgi:hypothetical protein
MFLRKSENNGERSVGRVIQVKKEGNLRFPQLLVITSQYFLVEQRLESVLRHILC